MSKDHDGDQFEEFAPRDQGFSLLRTRRQTVAWYARGAAIPAVVGVIVLAVAAHAVEHPKTPKATTSATTTTLAAPTTTTTKAPVVTPTTLPKKKKHPTSTTTTTTKPHVKMHPTPTTTTTLPKRPVTTTTRPTPTTTTTIFRPPTTTTTRPTTTTKKPKHPTTTTTTTTQPKQTSYSVTFTCAGGETVTVSGTGPSASNSLTVDGPIDNFASGSTATVSFTAVKGTYVATDTDASGGAFVNYISSPSTCS